MATVRFMLVGGFLGAGKTTLLRQAGQRLMAQGKTVGFITNDQAGHLVDTAMLRRSGFGVQEVAGGCFCCRFSDLMEKADTLLGEHKPDILIGEPVGSCTDVAATVMRPLQKFLPHHVKVAPFSVVVDPERLKQLLAPPKTSPLTEKVQYIFGKQLEEADLILLNKTDTLADAERDVLLAKLAERFPYATVLPISATEGAGLDAWLEQAALNRPAGQRGIEVDYQVYAEGEAELGWLNAAATLQSEKPANWKRIALDLLRDLKARLAARGAEVAHVKCSLTADGTALVGNLTSSHGAPFVLVQGPSEESSGAAYLILNARVQVDPGVLKDEVDGALAALRETGLDVEIGEVACFKPAPPVPTHREGLPEDCPMDGKEACNVVRDMFKPRKRTPKKD